MSRWPSRSAPRLALPLQLLMLHRHFPSGDGTLRNGQLLWRQKVQPTPISREYQLRISYADRSVPKAAIEHPCLSALAEGREIPHLYRQDPAWLCLYRPAYREWTAEQALAKTVVPWASLWLFYFEDWLISNEWRGGGEHPGSFEASTSRLRSLKAPHQGRYSHQLAASY